MEEKDNHIIIVNGSEVVPCKKVNLSNEITIGEIRKIIRDARLKLIK